MSYRLGKMKNHGINKLIFYKLYKQLMGIEFSFPFCLLSPNDDNINNNFEHKFQSMEINECLLGIGLTNNGLDKWELVYEH
ncbi:MAG: hypothetical protein ACPKPY_02295 [Nitrososphaeraceae archaeon]